MIIKNIKFTDKDFIIETDEGSRKIRLNFVGSIKLYQNVKISWKDNV